MALRAFRLKLTMPLRGPSAHSGRPTRSPLRIANGDEKYLFARATRRGRRVGDPQNRGYRLVGTGVGFL